ncbi:hypothetical protein MLD38_010304 [Melastoma candidum]|nr:hypothetical protein MLD38_010304 [Melastoma candidum]
MVETRFDELKKEQDVMTVVVSGLVDRMEGVTLQLKELQQQADVKWDMVQNHMAMVGKILQEWEVREFNRARRVDELSEEHTRVFQESGGGRYTEAGGEVILQ